MQEVKANFIVQQGTYQFQGCFDKFTIPEFWKRLQLSLTTEPLQSVDLSGITECDSALIALLVELKKLENQLVIINMPENLLQLLDLYQVKDLLTMPA